MTDFKFINRAPEDTEWSAYIHLLNEWTSPESKLRHIIQYARGGRFFPADMHVDLIEQWSENTRKEIALVNVVPAEVITDTDKEGMKSTDIPVDN